MIIYRLLFVCKDKASGVKFCTVVQWCPGQGISHFGELCSPEAQNPTNQRAAASIADRRHSPSVEGTSVYRQYLLSACVDRRLSQKTDVLVCLFVSTVTDLSAADKSSSVKFRTTVHRRPSHGISHFGKLCCLLPQKPQIGRRIGQRAQ